MSRCPIKHGTCHRETEKLCPTIDATGNRVCVLGAPTTIYKIVPKTDGTVDVALSYVHREHLKFIAARGEISYDYSKLIDKPEWLEKYREPLSAHIRHLVSMGLMNEYPLIGRDAVRQTLTDAGRKIVEMIREQEKQPTITAREIFRGSRSDIE